jgi:hypothetical protein
LLVSLTAKLRFKGRKPIKDKPALAVALRLLLELAGVGRLALVQFALRLRPGFQKEQERNAAEQQQEQGQ